MAFKITTFTAYSHSVVADNFATVDDAKSYLGVNSGNIVYMEEDSDNPGFYDLFLKDGRVVAIEPAGGDGVLT